MESLNGHEAGNDGYGQGRTYGNSPFLDPTSMIISFDDPKSFYYAPPK
jgi:hypothetical protein